MNVIHDDERFAEFLRGAVRGLDPSPEAVPREAMWAAIAAQRQWRAEPAVAPVIAFSADRATRKFAPAWLAGGVPMRWAMPAALSLMAAGIVVGVVIGRGGRSAPLGAPAPAQLASAAPATSTPPVAAPAAPAPDLSNAAPPEPEPLEQPPVLARPSALPKLKEHRTAPQRMIVPGEQMAVPVGTSPSTMGAQVVTTEYLVNAQQLFKTFELAARKDAKQDPKAAATMDEVVSKAEALMNDIELFLDMEARAKQPDKQRMELLRNIDFVLFQMIQLSSDQGANGRERVQSAIKRVDPKLKLAVPVTPQGGA